MPSPIKNKHLWIGVFAAFALWLACLFIVPMTFGWPEEAGQFGDMFGAVNALFTAFTTAGLIYTIWIQRTAV